MDDDGVPTLDAPLGHLNNAAAFRQHSGRLRLRHHLRPLPNRRQEPSRRTLQPALPHGPKDQMSGARARELGKDLAFRGSGKPRTTQRGTNCGSQPLGRALFFLFERAHATVRRIAPRVELVPVRIQPRYRACDGRRASPIMRIRELSRKLSGAALLADRSRARQRRLAGCKRPDGDDDGGLPRSETLYVAGRQWGEPLDVQSASEQPALAGQRPST